MAHSVLFRLFPSSWPQPVKSGLLLATGVSILGFSDTLVPTVSDEIGLSQFHVIRAVLALVGVVLLARMTGLSLWPQRWGVVLLRTFCIVMAMFLFFGVLSFLPTAVAGAGLFTSPIFVLIFLALFFGILPGPRRIVAVAAGSVGVWLLLRPDMSGVGVMHFLPVIAGGFYALNVIITNRYCADESPMALLNLYFIGIGVLGCLAGFIFTVFEVQGPQDAAFLLRGFEPMSGSAVIWLLVMALLTVLAVWMLNVAYQTAEASYLVVYEYSYLISAAICGWLIWSDSLSATSLIGMLLIIGAGIIISRKTVFFEQTSEQG